MNFCRSEVGENIRFSNSSKLDWFEKYLEAFFNKSEKASAALYKRIEFITIRRKKW